MRRRASPLARFVRVSAAVDGARRHNQAFKVAAPDAAVSTLSLEPSQA